MPPRRAVAGRKPFLGFVAVGSVGFVVDAGVLTLLSQSFGVNLYLARLSSFVIACLTTWILNRTFVFESDALNADAKKREYGRYFLVQTGGALLNLSVFSVLVAMVPSLRSMPVVPLAVASGCALFFNFAGSRLWVFGPAR